jgi:hypothetical protein
MRWIKTVIHTHFPEFVISGTMILLSRTSFGYTVMRALQPTDSDDFAWLHLEIRPLEEPPDVEKRQPKTHQVRGPGRTPAYQ